jgi:hypothetical protein
VSTYIKAKFCYKNDKISRFKAISTINTAKFVETEKKNQKGEKRSEK